MDGVRVYEKESNRRLPPVYANTPPPPGLSLAHVIVNYRSGPQDFVWAVIPHHMDLLALTRRLVRQLPSPSKVEFLSLAMMWCSNKEEVPPALEPLYPEGSNRGIYITSGIIQEAMRKRHSSRMPGPTPISTSHLCPESGSRSDSGE